MDITGTFKFKVNETQWTNKPILPITNGNGSFVSTDVNDDSVVTVSLADSSGNVTVIYNYTYKEQRNTNFNSGIVISNLTGDGFRAKSGINHSSMVITQWDNIPLSRNGTQLQQYYGTIEASDIPTIMTKTSFEWLLNECTSVETIPNINNWNIRNVVSLANAFIRATNFNSDISEWDTSNVITFENMFFAASNFNQNISANVIHKNGTSYVAWNTKNVVSFENTFKEEISFNNGET